MIGEAGYCRHCWAETGDDYHVRLPGGTLRGVQHRGVYYWSEDDLVALLTQAAELNEHPVAVAALELVRDELVADGGRREVVA